MSHEMTIQCLRNAYRIRCTPVAPSPCQPLVTNALLHRHDPERCRGVCVQLTVPGAMFGDDRPSVSCLPISRRLRPPRRRIPEPVCVATLPVAPVYTLGLHVCLRFAFCLPVTFLVRAWSSSEHEARVSCHVFSAATIFTTEATNSIPGFSEKSDGFIMHIVRGVSLIRK